MTFGTVYHCLPTFGWNHQLSHCGFPQTKSTKSIRAGPTFRCLPPETRCGPNPNCCEIRYKQCTLAITALVKTTQVEAPEKCIKCTLSGKTIESIRKKGGMMIFWVVATSNIFGVFIPVWGRWTHFDEHIFQRGWNHQPVLGLFLVNGVRILEFRQDGKISGEKCHSASFCWCDISHFGMFWKPIMIFPQCTNW